MAIFKHDSYEDLCKTNVRFSIRKDLRENPNLRMFVLVEKFYQFQELQFKKQENINIKQMITFILV